MQFPESWLREFCDPPLTTAALAELLTMSGMEVEETRPVAPPFTQIVVGEIVAAEPHPNADKLRVCMVNAGAHSPNGPLQVVCGAPNARVGIRVPLALVGATLPPAKDGDPPFKIAVGKLRGVDSFGMLCSARELKLSDDHGGLLELELELDAPVGADVRGVLQLDDTIFTLKLTPNLGHTLSVYGVAREVSALTGSALKTPRIEPVQPVHDQRLPVDVLAPDLCGRFSGRIVRGVNPQAATPAWMVDRLARCGQRPVTALVDISNYVMYEYGRPSHIFDLDKIHDKLIVRWGRVDNGKGESLTLLNGNTIEVDGTVGVIADSQGVESLAGIMGGAATAVGDATQNVYVEAAFWWPEAVAGRSRRFNFNTDAGHRFERGVDPATTVEHIERITALILEICGGQAGPMDDHIVALPERKAVTLRVARAAKVLGLPLTQAECADVFSRLKLEHVERDGVIVVTPPSWRMDLVIEEDLIEEVMRVIGLHRLPNTPPTAAISARPQPEAQRGANALRHAMAGLGYQETISFSFVEERTEHDLAGNADPIRVLNPIAAPLSVMRSSLLGSLITVLKTNLARKATRARIFEIGRVFKRDATVGDTLSTVAGVHQPMRLAGLLYGSNSSLQWGEAARSADFFDAKGDVQALLGSRPAQFAADKHPAMHPGRCARVTIEGVLIGHVGELHPRWRQSYELPQATLLFELDLDALMHRPLPAFVPLPKQQAAIRDLALVVSRRVLHDDLIASITADPAALVQSATLFDIYQPAQPVAGMDASERSLAIRLELLDDGTTLTDERIDAAVAAAIERARSACGARLRA